MRLEVSLNRMRSCSDVTLQDRLLDLQQLFFALCAARHAQSMRSELLNNCYFYGVRLNLNDRNNYSPQQFRGSLVQVHVRHFASDWLNSPTFPSVVMVHYMDAYCWYHTYVARSNLGELPPPSVGHVGYWKFAQLYPNIHTVKLNTTERPNWPVEAASFLTFLRHCRALNVLEIKYLNFGGDFYNQLRSMPALAGLRSLTVYERWGTNLNPEVKPCDLFEMFPHLTCFSTNLATRNEMYLLVAKQTTKMFEFQFRERREGEEEGGQQADWFRFQFTPNLKRSEYRLLIQRLSPRGHPVEILFDEPIAKQDVSVVLPNFFLESRHWRDEGEDIETLVSALFLGESSCFLEESSFLS